MTFTERFVDADGLRIRSMDGGQGPPLVHLHGAGGLRLSRAHELLAQRFRVVAFEMPAFGAAPANMRTRTVPELALTMAAAIEGLGLHAFDLMGTSYGGKAALWLALQRPDRVRGLVLEAPDALGPDRDPELEGRLPGLTVPTLVLFGTRDSVISPAMGRVYKERIPDCHLVFVYDAAHAISTDRPEAFTEVVGDFLERHEAFVISRVQTVIHP